MRSSRLILAQSHFLDGGPAGSPGTIDVMEVMSGGMGRGGAHGIRPRQLNSSSSLRSSSNQYYTSHGDTTTGICSIKGILYFNFNKITK